MKKIRVSAGLLMFRVRNGELEVFLAHPGGPLFQRKDEAHWTIPKGEPNSGEELIHTALREFQEEVGHCPRGPFLPLGSIVQKGGKVVFAWAFSGDWALGQVHRCNEFEMEWPPNSGALKKFPEIDQVQFFPLEVARKKLKETQAPFLDRLAEALAHHGSGTRITNSRD